MLECKMVVPPHTIARRPIQKQLSFNNQMADFSIVTMRKERSLATGVDDAATPFNLYLHWLQFGGVQCLDICVSSHFQRFAKLFYDA